MACHIPSVYPLRLTGNTLLLDLTLLRISSSCLEKGDGERAESYRIQRRQVIYAMFTLEKLITVFMLVLK